MHYPSLLDANLQLLALCLDYRLPLRYVEGHVVIIFGLLYSVQNTLFMWITWVDRFSGNANFFYFQTIIYALFHVIMYIQIFGAVDKKSKK
jgi:hypothetical protein